MSAPLTLAVRRALFRIPVILSEDGFAIDQDLAAELRIDYADVRTAAGILYRRRRVDRCAGYLVPYPEREPIRLPAASGSAA